MQTDPYVKHRGPATVHRSLTTDVLLTLGAPALPLDGD